MDKRRFFESLPNMTACQSTLICMRRYVWSSFQIISIGLNGAAESDISDRLVLKLVARRRRQQFANFFFLSGQRLLPAPSCTFRRYTYIQFPDIYVSNRLLHKWATFEWILASGTLPNMPDYDSIKALAKKSSKRLHFHEDCRVGNFHRLSDKVIDVHCSAKSAK